MAITYQAVQKSARISPRKVRPVLPLIRGKRVEEALHILEFDKTRGSDFVRKVVQSAAANAQDRGGVDPMDLRILQAHVDEAAIIHRWRPASRGRVGPIKRRNSHITIIVGVPQPAAAGEQG